MTWSRPSSKACGGNNHAAAGADMRIRFLVASALLLTLPSAVAAQSWPAKQLIRVILPFSPGSSLDTLGRPVFDHAAREIGQSFVFEHRPGAGGTLGMA